ncbi:MAG: glycosyltransferase family 39 protein [Bryobacteraceae bacterium]
MARKQGSVSASTAPASPQPPPEPPLPSPLRLLGSALVRHAGLFAILLVIAATARIAATYRVYNHTSDEPFHIACGVEWITKGTYELEEQHPPLARILTAIGPSILGAKLLGRDDNLYDEGGAVLYQGKDYWKRLTLARVGILPAFWAACAILWAWTRRCYGRDVALASLFLFTTLPAILAHAGLATTDMTLLVTLVAALLGFLWFVTAPSMKTGIVAGAGLALAFLSKFSTVPFYPCALAAVIALALLRDRGEALPCATRWRAMMLPAAAGLGVCLVLIWAGYRFSFGSSVLGFPMPAPEIAEGIRQVLEHNEGGHRSWLLGEYSPNGFWYYYPVALLFKLPIPFLLLTVWGAILAWSRKEAVYRVPIGLSAGILLFSLTSRINIGIRHVLPVLVFFTVLAALAAVTAIRSRNRWQALAGIALLAWMLGSGVVAHPDYLPYFNALAGNQPEDILVDSDLDWGQDMERLGRRLRELGAKQVAMNPLVIGFWEEEHGFPKIVPLHPREPKPGWNALSLTMLKLSRIGTREQYPDMIIWTDNVHFEERVGSGIVLFYSPEK